MVEMSTPTTAAGRALLEYIYDWLQDDDQDAAEKSALRMRVLAIEVEARASRETELDVERLREALLHLVAMVEENGPEYADSDAMLDAREALTPENPR